MNLFEPLQPSGHRPIGSGEALQPGYMLEDFEITQVLGATAHGVLYLATHVVDQNTVAIKEYLPSTMATRDAEGRIELIDPTDHEAFHRGLMAFVGEALTLSQFDHPHLLRVTCVWEANGTAYRAMPYLVGPTLQSQRAASSEPATQAQLQALLDGLLGALEELSNADLAHGHIDPANIVMVDGDRPVLMDFNAVAQALQSNVAGPHVDVYADPDRHQETCIADLHAVAAVLHFAVSNQWGPGRHHRYERLDEVLAHLKDSASALSYTPEFLAGVDMALGLPPDRRPDSGPQFRALFDPNALPPPARSTKRAKTVRKHKRPLPERPPNVYPLNTSESVLALLANFDRGPVKAPDDIEPFENPPVPTLTEEAEPALPPMRKSLFDAMDAGEALPFDGVGYAARGYRPMPPIPAARWRRLLPLMSVGAFVLACVIALGWALTA